MGQTVIQGEYFFRRQEMVAAFKFTENGRFEFFYSYGAVDRSASGHFTIDKDTIRLNSDKEPGHDFIIDKQYQEGSAYTIYCHAPNAQLLPYMQCIAFVGDQKYSFESDSKGVILVDLPNCDKIYVRHTLFPDIPTLIKDEKNSNNRFEISLQPSVQQLSFKGIDLLIKDDHTLSCMPNYFMPIENILFKKD